MPLSPLPIDFYQHSAVEVARSLLGMRLVRCIDRVRLAGIITETEAYMGEEDLACHARAGRTPRTAVMYGTPGCAYVYFIYGMHWMLNCVTAPEGVPHAVLIRAVEIVEGEAVVAQTRQGIARAQWSNGPARLCKALQIDGSLNTVDLTQPAAGLWIEPDTPPARDEIYSAARVGINYAPSPWREKPWRFMIKSSITR